MTAAQRCSVGYGGVPISKHSACSHPWPVVVNTAQLQAVNNFITKHMTLHGHHFQQRLAHAQQNTDIGCLLCWAAESADPEQSLARVTIDVPTTQVPRLERHVLLTAEYEPLQQVPSAQTMGSCLQAYRQNNVQCLATSQVTVTKPLRSKDRVSCSSLARKYHTSCYAHVPKSALQACLEPAEWDAPCLCKQVSVA